MAEDAVARPLPIAGALLLTILEVALFTFGMCRPSPPNEPAPIAVRLVTLPSPSPSPASVPDEAMPTIETEAPQPQSPSIEPPHPAPRPTAITPPSPPPTKPRSLRHTASRPALLRAERSSPAASVPALPANAPPPGGGTMGARAIYRPMPEIPEELRRHPTTLVAVARFHVAADGTATAVLIAPTPDPRLNAALLAALAQWRFFPAMANGRPVASTIDIRIPIVVR